ncbi:katanin p80 WD40 containing subunit B1 [Trichuris trichiura]|uniref:Katanin p80 WD40 containing subunit B1 n=1 Tax=Trichuris trichiura TaxID=36087 RepID=A0A077ZD53_TRITR|nr:katanin p80 WD40 containing subunit B1 [Trichuris trichiura]
MNGSMACKISSFATNGLPTIRRADMVAKKRCLVATAGNDRTVRLWQSTSAVPMLSMIGHLCPIETLRFSGDECLLASGSVSGIIKFWDLSCGSAICSISDNEKTISCLANSSLCRNVWASGNTDGSARVWDTRSPAKAVLTFQPHAKSVGCLEFSPHGSWLFTGSDDCSVKIWDLRCKQNLTTFDQHLGPVQHLDFHPGELLLASASADKTVRFWDLETFECVGQSDCDPMDIRSIAFHDKGLCLYSASSAGLRVLDWEPIAVYHNVAWQALHRCWPLVRVIRCEGNCQQLFTLCLQPDTSELCVLSVGMHLLAPLTSKGDILSQVCDEKVGTFDSELPLCRPDSLRLNAYDADAELPKVSRTRTFDNIASEQLSDELSAFRPSRSLQRTPPPSVTVTNAASRTFSLEQGLDSHCSSCQDRSNDQKAGFSQLRCSSSSSLAVDLDKPKMLERQKGAATSTRGFAQGNGRLPLSSRKSMTAISSTHSEPTSTTGDLSEVSPVCLGRSQGVSSSKVVLNKKKKQTVATVTPMSSPSSKQAMSTQATRKLVHEVSPLVRNQARRAGDLSPVRQLANEFGRLGGRLEATGGISPPMRIPCSGDFSTSSVMDSSVSGLELDILKLVDKGGISITTVLGYRQKRLEMIAKLAASRGLKFGLQEVVRQDDVDSILVDVLNVLNQKPEFTCYRKVWTLDICTILLPHIQSLLRSKHDSYCRTAISTLLLILRGFSLMFIDYSKMQCPPGTNITTEERAEKCRECCCCLMQIRDDVTEMTKLTNADVTSGSSSEIMTLCAMLGSLVDSIASHPQDS